VKKYLYIFKSEIMTSLTYKFDVFVSFIGYAIHIFIFLNLWRFIYSDPSELINGYTINDMIWYVAITEIVWSAVGGRGLCKKIARDVKGGNITYNLIKPYNYVEYSYFSNMGHSSYKLIMYTILGLLLGYLFLGSFPNITIISMLAVLLSLVLACSISIIIITCIGLLSFFIEDAHPLFWVYSKIILVFGIMFPIEFFPEPVALILKYSPAYTVCYGPAKLFIHFSSGAFIEIIISQIITLIIFSIIAHLIYKKGAKKLNVNGG